MDEGTRVVINKKLARARAAYGEAQTLSATQQWMGCANRMYYACFHAASALLLTKDLTPKTHAGVRSLLGQHFVKTDEIPPEFGNFYSELFLLRQQADYHDLFVPHEAELRSWMKQAEVFIETVERIIGASN